MQPTRRRPEPHAPPRRGAQPSGTSRSPVTPSTSGRKAPAPPEPWSDDVRGCLVRVLAAGPPAVTALESIDRRHLLERYLPEWAAVRNKPQRNPYHRFTVDRHLLEATANAATLAHRVERADLLLLGTLLHDIGKGFPGDHTEVGMVVTADIGARIGLPPRTWRPWSRWCVSTSFSRTPRPEGTSTTRRPPSVSPERSATGRASNCSPRWSRPTASPPVRRPGDRGRRGWSRTW